MDHKGYSKELRLGIGGVTISINPIDNIRFELDDAYRHFFAGSKPKPDLSINLHDRADDALPLKPGDRIFETSGVWDLYCRAGDFVFSCYSEELGRIPSRRAVINKDFTSGDIFFNKTADEDGLPYPFGYPLDEILMIQLLSLGRGMMVHGCGLEIGGEGFLFVGSSGKGKSTIAGILKEEAGAVILNDDRTIVRKIGAEYRIYGTPWHGDVKECSGGTAPLKRIYFINHADGNSSAKLSSPEAAARLIACSFSPFWDMSGMAFILDFASGLSEKTPSFSLGFLPDKTIAKFLKDIK